MSYSEVADADISSETTLFTRSIGNSASDSSDLTRISGRDLSRNTNILNHISSTQFYWSMSNPYTVAYRASLEMPDPYVYSYSNYDDRSTPTALASVKYYLTHDNNSAGIPYGYEYVTSENIRLPLWEKYNNMYKRMNGYEPTETQLENIRNRFTDIYSVFVNSCPIPITYCYDSYVYELPEQKIDDPITRQQLQLETCFTDQVSGDVSAYDEKTSDYHISNEIRCNGNEITRSDKGFITTSYNTTADITFSDSANSETYIRFKNFRFTPTCGYDLYNNDLTIDPLNHYTKADYRILDPYSRHLLRTDKINARYDNDVTISVSVPGGVNKSFNYRAPEAPFSSGRHNYVIT